MSDKKFVDVGDELVVRIGGYSIGKARVKKFDQGDVLVEFMGSTYRLPADVKSHDTVDCETCRLYDEDERPCSACRIKKMGGHLWKTQ